MWGCEKNHSNVLQNGSSVKHLLHLSLPQSPWPSAPQPPCCLWHGLGRGGKVPNPADGTSVAAPIPVISNIFAETLALRVLLWHEDVGNSLSPLRPAFLSGSMTGTERGVYPWSEELKQNKASKEPGFILRWFIAVGNCLKRVPCFLF